MNQLGEAPFGTFTLKLSDFFLSLKITEKILIGFVLGAAIPVMLGVFSLFTLQGLNAINKEIIEVIEPTINLSEKLIDTLLAQELYGSRYELSRNVEMNHLYRQKSAEFDRLIGTLGGLSANPVRLIGEIDARHGEYNTLFDKKFEGGAGPLTDEIGKKQAEIISMIKELLAATRVRHNERNITISRMIRWAFSATILLCGLGIVVGAFATAVITRNISGSIDKLKFASRKIAEGDFENVPEIRHHDEMWELADAFKYMGMKLRQLEALHLDASPLTKLPGGTAIEKLLETRLGEQVPTAFCLIDMDNFKAYNDRYGYAKGSELIKVTAGLIKETVKTVGSNDDFVGHIGGDDFAIITTPADSRRICEAVIERFDATVPDYYSPEDRQRGYIVGKTRQGEKAKFPLVSISIAAVFSQAGTLSNPIELGAIAAELKEAAKKIPGSAYVEDRRHHDQ